MKTLELYLFVLVFLLLVFIVSLILRKRKQRSLIIYLTKYNKELKKSFTDEVSEIKKLVEENKLLESCNQENLKKIAYLKAVKNHKKRPVFEPKVKEWECVNPEYYPKFHVGRKYKDAITVAVDFDKETTLCLLSENGIACLVEKIYFKPVKET